MVGQRSIHGLGMVGEPRGEFFHQTPPNLEIAFGDALPVMTSEQAGAIVPGRPDSDGARSALAALETATGLARSGAARALVTGPLGGKSQAKVSGESRPRTVGPRRRPPAPGGTGSRRRSRRSPTASA